MSKHGEGVSPPSAANIFNGSYMSRPGREANECISPEVVRSSDAGADVASYLEPGKHQRADDREECYFSIAALSNKANDALGLR